MSELPGASSRQSRTRQRLTRSDPAGITALAAVGLVLRDALHGNDDPLPAALNSFGCGSFEPRFSCDHAANLMSSFWGAYT